MMKDHFIKGTVHRFDHAGQRNRLQLMKMVYLKHFSYFKLVEFMVSRIGPIVPLLLLVNYFGPICDTIKSTLADTGMKNTKHS